LSKFIRASSMRPVESATRRRIRLVDRVALEPSHERDDADDDDGQHDQRSPAQDALVDRDAPRRRRCRFVARRGLRAAASAFGGVGAGLIGSSVKSGASPRRGGLRGPRRRVRRGAQETVHEAGASTSVVRVPPAIRAASERPVVQRVDLGDDDVGGRKAGERVARRPARASIVGAGGHCDQYHLMSSRERATQHLA
jgi:hypothetical protein